MGGWVKGHGHRWGHGPWAKGWICSCTYVFAWVCVGMLEDARAQASSSILMQTHANPDVHEQIHPLAHGPGPWPHPWPHPWPWPLPNHPTPPPPGGASILGPFDKVRGGWRAKCQFEHIGPIADCSPSLGPIKQHFECIVRGPVGPRPCRWPMVGVVIGTVEREHGSPWEPFLEGQGRPGRP